MSEGTRELVARAIEGVLLSGGAPRCRELAEMAAKHVVEDLTEAGALAPAGPTSDSFTERDLDTIGLAVWVTSTAMTERRFVGLDLIEKLHACGFDIVRVAPAADAAPGAPS